MKHTQVNIDSGLGSKVLKNFIRLSGWRRAGTSKYYTAGPADQRIDFFFILNKVEGFYQGKNEIEV